MQRVGRISMKMRTEYTCPLELVHDMIKGKWKPIILWRLPIKIFVLGNGGYGAIYGTQTNLFAGHLVACNEQSDLTMPDTASVAQAYGLRTVRIRNNREIEAGVRETLAGNDPVICDVRVPIDLKVFPKQISYKRSDGQMESLPLEYMNPMLEEDEFLENMLIPLYEKK